MTRQPRRRDLYDSWSERKRRAAIVARWRETHGDLCPGLPGIRPPHPSVRLAADHIDEVHRGGDPKGDLAVLCPSCNSTKSNLQRGKRRFRVPNASREW